MQKATHYIQASLRPDLFAGLTVALIAMPQAMAYAAIAGVNPVYGIYTAIVPTIVGALLGSSSFLITGPSNASSLVTYTVLSQSNDARHFVELAFLLAILSGVIKLVMGLLRMGGIIRYISNSVLTGFLGAIGVLITLEQFGNLFGITIPKNQGAFAILLATLQKVPEFNLYVLATSATCIALMLVMRRLDRRLPAAMLAIILSALFVSLLGWESQGVKLVGQLTLTDHPGLTFHIPKVTWQSALDLLPTAGAVALFSLVEAMSISRALSLSSGQKIHPTREFIAQGLASITGGFFQCIPSSGSPSRSAVNYNAGAKTRFSAVSSGIFVWLTLVIFSTWIGYIPLPGLAGVVVVSAIGLIDLKHMRLTWNTRSYSRVVMVATIAATLLLPLQIAIYLGVLLTILIHLYESSHLNLSYLILKSHEQVIERPVGELYESRARVAVINVEGDLFFGAVNDLEDAIHRCQQIGVKVLVLRVRSARLLASTGITTLQALILPAQKAGMTILLSGVSSDVHKILCTSQLISLIGEDHVFRGSDVLFESTRQAYQCAQELLEQAQITSSAP